MQKLNPKFPLPNKSLSQVLTQLMKSSTLKPLLSSIKQDFNAHMQLTSNVSVPCEGTSIDLIFQFINACDLSLHEALIPPTSTSSSMLNGDSSQSPWMQITGQSPQQPPMIASSLGLGLGSQNAMVMSHDAASPAC